LVFALMLDWLIPSLFNWPIFRWALGGTGFGILIGSYCEPIRLVRGGAIEASGRGRYFVAIAVVLATVIKLFNGGHAGSVFAGMIGGAIGGLWASAMLAAFGGNEAAEWLGSYLVIPIVGALLGALGGGCAGWVSWRTVTAGAEPGAPTQYDPPSDRDV
jgi:hypothetical protein